MTIIAIAVTCISSDRSDDKYLIKKRNIRIVITDSGLGGLSVMEDIALKISNSNYYESAELIFVNALFDALSGIPEGISDIFISLNSSHYGYSEKLCKEAALNSGSTSICRNFTPFIRGTT